MFLSGTSIFNEPAWWTLMYPKLSPLTVSQLYALLNLEKQKAKIRNEKLLIPDAVLFENILTTYIKNEGLIQRFTVCNAVSVTPANDNKEDNTVFPDLKKTATQKTGNGSKPKIILPSIGGTSRKLMKLASSSVASSTDELTVDFDITDFQEQSQSQSYCHKSESQSKVNYVKLLDPYCHYNTSLNNISRIKGQQMAVKLTGGVRREQILSPYSALYLKPYIRRDSETTPMWLQLMAELQVVVNKNNSDYVLPPRAPIEYVYVQPEHIPAINSLCNQFFWPGIDLTEALQYPEFSCVVLYKRLIIGFAFLVPDVTHTESYLSFVFTRQNWRNCGIATFMIYHLIQTSLGKDVTLHVSINNPALFLYQKFGFKVEKVELDFYDKYFRSDVNDSKHAFFCRLER
ncbi:hypothetical protein NQ315_009398 [Exocentrus adspersus]|uniref:N-acetyltransferase domain-containing protein n=1 Tax=Exocentrus adspersus TaxID=1586481 RepID=A0AAV8WGK1_9CUCU|nr:hypothetical protein NQ315_009398 [Exocentrus adspersus]